jgi:hypothetical protein
MEVHIVRQGNRVDGNILRLARLRRVRLLFFLGFSFASLLHAQDVLTYHNDNARTGQDLHEVILNPSNVNVTQFGKVFQVAVDGKVDAEPLYASGMAISGQGTHNVLFVATEHDSFYAFDADTGAQLWQVSLAPASETTSDNRGCGQVTPEIGITATPVIDRMIGPNGTIYVVAMTKDSSGAYHQRLHALDMTTGAELLGGPKEIQATFPGTGANSNGTDVVFDPAQYKERPGLLLLDHVIYTAWSSHCDIDPYTAWIIAYDESDLNQLNVLDLTPNGHEGSVWMSGAGMAADSDGNIYALLANGTFDTTLDANGFPSQGDYGNAFVKLSTANGGLAVADYFTMSNTVAESNADEDLGSGGALVLPDMTDVMGTTRHLAVGAGKDQAIYLVDRDNMGKFSPVADNIYQELQSALAGGIFSMPAYYNGRLYYGPVGNSLLAFQFSNARLLTSPVSATSTIFTYPGATPSVSANGTSSAIVWATENTDPAVLHAYDATDLSRELYNSNQAGTRDQFGIGNKFITPMIANGKVYVGTTNGVGAFGLLGPAAAVSPTTLSFGGQLVGTISSSQTVTLKNIGSGPITISNIEVTGDFGESDDCPASPSTLDPPAACVIDVTFRPTAAEHATGILRITYDAVGSPQEVALSGAGQDYSLSLSAASATINAGQPSTATLSVTPAGGMNQVVSLSCSVSPVVSHGPKCSVSPSSVTPDGTNPATATVTITTTARGAAVWPDHRLMPPISRLPWMVWLVLSAFWVLGFKAAGKFSRSTSMRTVRTVVFATGLLVASIWTSCGGGGGGSSFSPPAMGGTPAGAYTISVTASAAGVSRGTSLSLTVQ